MDIVYKDFNILSENQVMKLYQDLGWTSYTKNIKNLLFGIQNSSFVYTAWDQKTLVGLIRVVSDDYTVCYIQDLLVLKDYQHQGIGTKLMNEVLERYGHVRQMILTTDEKAKDARAFYHSWGFELTTKQGCVTLLRVKNNN